MNAPKLNPRKTGLKRPVRGWVAPDARLNPQVRRQGRFNGVLKGVWHPERNLTWPFALEFTYYPIMNRSQVLIHMGKRMSRQKPKKRIHFMEVEYRTGMQPAGSFQSYIERALGRQSEMVQTEVTVPKFGTASVRAKQAYDGSYLLDVGAGALEESVTTMGIGSHAEEDVDQKVDSPSNRVFKHSNAFCLLNGNRLLVMLDGEFSINRLRYYFQQLIDKAGISTAHQAFEIKPVANLDQEQILAREGVKALSLKGVASAATRTLQADENAKPRRMEKFIAGFWDLFADDGDTEEEKQRLARAFGLMNVSVSISADGGSLANQEVLEEMARAGEELLEADADDAEITIFTTKGTPITPSSLVLHLNVYVSRNLKQNDLIRNEAWDKLKECKAKLIEDRVWQT